MIIEIMVEEVEKGEEMVEKITEISHWFPYVEPHHIKIEKKEKNEVKI